VWLLTTTPVKQRPHCHPATAVAATTAAAALQNAAAPQLATALCSLLLCQVRFDTATWQLTLQRWWGCINTAGLYMTALSSTMHAFTSQQHDCTAQQSRVCSTHQLERCLRCFFTAGHLDGTGAMCVCFGALIWRGSDCGVGLPVELMAVRVVIH
jgi:hypothetical protein